MLRHIPTPVPVPQEQVDRFHRTLQEQLRAKLQAGTWDPTAPARGSAYRSLLCVGGRVDSLIADAAAAAGIADVESFFPVDLTLWIDPHCVSYRTGSDHTPVVHVWEDRLAAFTAAASAYAQPKVVFRNPALDPRRPPSSASNAATAPSPSSLTPVFPQFVRGGPPTSAVSGNTSSVGGMVMAS
ncbi:hypothetical protein HK405_006267 [Cladochytrium tenue]|nr:hypothetical protein HK405_006267 [Cladochytrium tenue]